MSTLVLPEQPQFKQRTAFKTTSSSSPGQAGGRERRIVIEMAYPKLRLKIEGYTQALPLSRIVLYNGDPANWVIIVILGKILWLLSVYHYEDQKKRPFYHLVVADKRAPRDGRHLERVGFFNPIARGAEVRLRVDQERVEYWLSHGAQMSDRARQLIKQAKKQQLAAADGEQKPEDGSQNI